jgi:NAD(P)-dependent dehydrogenase (short-subunit alcohol dehydrogenase family)
MALHPRHLECGCTDFGTCSPSGCAGSEEVGCTSSAEQRAAPCVEDVSDFGWYEEMMRVNYMGTVWCTRYALAELRKAKRLVVGIPGITAKVGAPEHTALTASKCAQAGFLEALRTELVLP